MVCFPGIALRSVQRLQAPPNPPNLQTVRITRIGRLTPSSWCTSTHAVHTDACLRSRKKAAASQLRETLKLHWKGLAALARELNSFGWTFALELPAGNGMWRCSRVSTSPHTPVKQHPPSRLNLRAWEVARGVAAVAQAGARRGYPALQQTCPGLSKAKGAVRHSGSDTGRWAPAHCHRGRAAVDGERSGLENFPACVTQRRQVCSWRHSIAPAAVRSHAIRILALGRGEGQRREHHPTHPRHAAECAQDSRQLSAGNVQERGQAEDPVEVALARRRLAVAAKLSAPDAQEVGAVDRSPGTCSGHLCELLARLQALRLVAQLAEGGQVATGPAACIENPQSWLDRPSRLQLPEEARACVSRRLRRGPKGAAAEVPGSPRVVSHRPLHRRLRADHLRRSRCLCI
mmetsp:Transcript_43711/g.121495  ORF Transcript_43711/g.121495 Transcript_43711/m.121495 type:complete len:403 (-) Transcript_43711:178-1386(-)